MEEQGLIGLIDECRDMRDVDSLPNIGELTFLAQAIEKLAKRFVH